MQVKVVRLVSKI